MEMMPMLLIITMATYTLGKIAMMAVPVEGKQDKLLVRALSCVFFFLFSWSLSLYCGQYRWKMQVFPGCK